MTVDEIQKLWQDRIGQKRMNKDGITATVVGYTRDKNGNKKLTYEYDDFPGVTQTCNQWKLFDEGKFQTPREYYASTRENKQVISNTGYIGTCIKYNNSQDVEIKIDGVDEIVHATWNNFLTGSFDAPFGKYGNIRDMPFNELTHREYDIWTSMFKRCFSEKLHEDRPSYIDCSIAEEWYLCSNFIQWLRSQTNYDKWTNADTKWCLDKDILCKHNKIYCPDYCTLVPNRINCLIISCTRKRGAYPIGVYDRGDGKFRAQCSNYELGRQDIIGQFDTPEEAFYMGYKPYKENWIKVIAKEEFDKGNITQRCYDALCNYVVEIDD